MLAQVALLWILSRLLPPGHTPFHVIFRTDNSPSQSAAWKGLTLARGMCQFLRQFCLLQETVRISVHLDSVPGFLNDVADALSRAVPPATLGFQPAEVFSVPWTSFPEVPDFSHGELRCSLRLIRAQILMAFFPAGSSSGSMAFGIFRHQNSVLAALPVGQVDFSVCRACQGLFCLPTASKRECVSQGVY